MRVTTLTFVTSVNNRSTAMISSSWCSKGNTTTIDVSHVNNAINRYKGRNLKWWSGSGIVALVDRLYKSLKKEANYFSQILLERLFVRDCCLDIVSSYIRRWEVLTLDVSEIIVIWEKSLLLIWLWWNLITFTLEIFNRFLDFIFFTKTQVADVRVWLQ